jgi:hypothetical protein
MDDARRNSPAGTPRIRWPVPPSAKTQLMRRAGITIMLTLAVTTRANAQDGKP